MKGRVGYLFNKHERFYFTWAWTKSDVNLVISILKHYNPPVLHVCSGCSSIGDVRLDICNVFVPELRKKVGHDFINSPNVLSNMIELPFKDSSFPTVICDPPYRYQWFENGIYQKMIDEIVRVTKVRGTILFYAPVVFTHPTLYLQETKYRQMGKRCYFKILSTSIKKNGQVSDYG